MDTKLPDVSAVQAVGRKTVWLAPPNATGLYPYPSKSGNEHNPASNTTEPSMSNTSQVDVFITDAELQRSREIFPAFWEDTVANAMSVTLDPGDLLFFPPGWWHAMRSAELSFSVSAWF